VSLRTLTAIASVGRALFGAAFVAAPSEAGSRWIGPVAEDERVGILLRAVGARDIALGVGTVRAIAEDRDASGWLLASAASDSIDFAATLAARDGLPARSAAITLVLAGGSAALFAAAAMGSVTSVPRS
jgi:hypothetical protein